MICKLKLLLFTSLVLSVQISANDDITFDDNEEISVTKWSLNSLRERRQTEGSGEAYDDEYDDYSNENEVDAPEIKPTLDPVSPVFELVSVVPTDVVEPSRVVLEATSAIPDHDHVGHSGDGPVIDLDVTSSTVQSTISTEATTTTATPTLPTTAAMVPPQNAAPTLQKRLDKKVVDAGSVFVFEIPSEIFRDFEDGDTKLLKLSMKMKDGSDLPDDSWIGFDTIKQTISAMPLDKDIGKYEFILEATDSNGEKVSDTIDFQVRQDPKSRTFHHKISMEFTVDPDSPEGFNRQHDLLLHTVKKLSKYFNLDDQIGKHMYLHSYSFEPLVLTVTNSSLKRNNCPCDEIEDLMEKIIGVDREVVPELGETLAPQLRLKSANVSFMGVCESMCSQITETPSVNNPPEIRNPIDELNVYSGELLRYKVPEDTFYDPEDGNTRNLKLTLQTMDRTAIDSNNWLQFDVANREFYGVPLSKDVGRVEYQLVCTDSQGASVVDGMIVVVQERPKDEKYNVEFSLNLDMPYDDFSKSAHHKLRFLETLARLYGDADTSHIVLQSVSKSTPDFHESKGQTLVSWTNKSIEFDPCPDAVITQLRVVLIKDDGQLTKNASDTFFSQELTPLSGNLRPLATCLGMTTPTYRGSPRDEAPTEPPTATNGVNLEDYLFTFIVPGLIIATMLIIALIIACVLYRRQRSGKMYVEERQNFMSKGIPVIFAEELDEKPEQPVKLILRDEARATLPPGYKRSGTPKHSSVSPTPEQRELLPRNGGDERYPTFKAV